MTITEALAEIKTIGKRIEKKRQAVLANIGRDSRLKDPLEDSVAYVKQERQAIDDLEKRWVRIRTEIQRSNLEKTVTVGENTYTVQEWLNFRREVADNRKMFLMSLNQAVANIRSKATQQGARVMAAAAATTTVHTGDAKPVEILLHLEEKELLAEQEGLEKTLGDLDGKLSLFNATTVIDV